MAFKTAVEVSQHISRLHGRSRAEMKCPLCGEQGSSNWSLEPVLLAIPRATGDEGETLLEAAGGASAFEIPAGVPLYMASCSFCRHVVFFRADAGRGVTYKTDSPIVYGQDGGPGWK